ncbi:unnamed protein product, partial [Urochloa humidicola]
AIKPSPGSLLCELRDRRRRRRPGPPQRAPPSSRPPPRPPTSSRLPPRPLSASWSSASVAAVLVLRGFRHRPGLLRGCRRHPVVLRGRRRRRPQHRVQVQSSVDLALAWMKKYFLEYEQHLRRVSAWSMTYPSEDSSTVGSPVLAKRQLGPEFANFKSSRRKTRAPRLMLRSSQSCQLWHVISLPSLLVLCQLNPLLVLEDGFLGSPEVH